MERTSKKARQHNIREARRMKRMPMSPPERIWTDTDAAELELRTYAFMAERNERAES